MAAGANREKDSSLSGLQPQPWLPGSELELGNVLLTTAVVDLFVCLEEEILFLYLPWVLRISCRVKAVAC